MTGSNSGPMRSTAPAGSPQSYSDPKTIDALLKSSAPGTVAEAGRSYQKFASAYEKIAAELLSMRTDLHEAWTGQDAAAAQAQLREVWAAATTVHKTASTFGVAVERHGSESLAWYKNNKPPSKDLTEARSWMTGANERVSQSWSSLPQDLSTSLPPGNIRDGHSPASGAPTYGGGSMGGSADGDGGTSRPVQMGPISEGSHGGHLPSSGGSSELAGFSPPGGSTLPPGTVGGLPPGGGGDAGLPPSFTTSSGMPGAGLPPGLIGSAGQAGLNGVRPGSMGSSPRLGSGGRSFGSAAAEETQALESGAAARSGLAGPISGGAAGQKERERTRKTWLAEDEDLWTGGIESAPGLIGEESGAVREPEPVEPVLELDLSGDDDVLASLLEELGAPGDIDGERGKDTSTEIAELRAKLERLERQAAEERATAQSDFDWLPKDED